MQNRIQAFAMVVGGSSGIGLATAQKLLQAGIGAVIIGGIHLN